MKRKSISKYLRPQRLSNRRSTFSNAFASALAHFDRFDDTEVVAALADLGQDPNADLECVYCGLAAATWDHVFPRVIAGEFSGHGHAIRNLVPCCRRCNEMKGKMDWRKWIEQIAPPDMAERIVRIERFLGAGTGSETVLDMTRTAAPEQLARYLAIRDQIFVLLKEADDLADTIRREVSEATLAKAREG